MGWGSSRFRLDDLALIQLHSFLGMKQYFQIHVLVNIVLSTEMKRLEV
jgi:hypothetical protein